MDLTLNQRLDILLDAYSHHYSNITRDVETEHGAFAATADFFVRDENYAFSKKAVLSAFEQYEYAYFYLADHLDETEAKQLLDRTLKAGTARVRPHKEHKSSYVTLIILANTISEEAKVLIKKTRFQKNFRLSLHGWMEYHIAAMECSTQSFLSNPGGKGARKNLELNFGSRAK
jgi:hypothetical protein